MTAAQYVVFCRSRKTTPLLYYISAVNSRLFGKITRAVEKLSAGEADIKDIWVGTGAEDEREVKTENADI